MIRSRSRVRDTHSITQGTSRRFAARENRFPVFSSPRITFLLLLLVKLVYTTTNWCLLFVLYYARRFSPRFLPPLFLSPRRLFLSGTFQWSVIASEQTGGRRARTDMHPRSSFVPVPPRTTIYDCYAIILSWQIEGLCVPKQRSTPRGASYGVWNLPEPHPSLASSP